MEFPASEPDAALTALTQEERKVGVDLNPILRVRAFAYGLALISLCGAARGQTFDVNGQGGNSSAAPAKSDHPKSSPETGMGWGSGIEVSRQARAAQIAIEHGDYRAAVNYAQRAAQLAPQNPDLWFALAYAARLAGQYSLSVDSYRHGLSQRPSSIEGLSGLAQTYAKMGKSAEAQQVLQQVLAANPRSDTDLQLAGELLLESDPQKGIEYLERSEAVKRSARTELLLARGFQRTGKPDQAKDMLERARQSAPKNPEVLRAVAAYYRDSGQYESAIQVLKNILSADPNTLAELAYSYQLVGDKRSAAANYLKAAQGAPRQIEFQLNAAQALVGAGEFDRASKVLDHAAALDPGHYRVHAVRGQMYAMQHREQDAIHEYETALSSLSPTVPEGVLYPTSLRVDLSELYRDSGDAANAERVAKAARSDLAAINIEGSGRPEFLRLRAATEIATGDTSSADSDLAEALKEQPGNSVILLNYANLLWKTDRRDAALQTYRKVLALEPDNPAALSSLGFLMRETGDSKSAELYFQKLAHRDPGNFVPFLALGDLYSSNREFARARANYEKAFALAPSHPLIVSGAMNAAMEGKQLPLAKQWLDRASEDVRNNPQVMRERERYLTMTGDFAASAELGPQVLEKLPGDREAVDYLAYDLLFLNRYDEASAIVSRYREFLPKDRDLPLIAGYVAAHNNEDEEAVRDFATALEIDPQMATGYMNRGYVYNDMRQPTKAESDFRKALSLNPNYGEAHLGLAYALLQLRRSSAALKEAQLAAKLLPDSGSLHLAKAEAYRQRAMWTHAKDEYGAALKLNPNDAAPYLALADVQYRLRQYQTSADTLKQALSVSNDRTTGDAMIHAELARSYAKLQNPDQAMQEIRLAEQNGGKDYKILLVTAEVLQSMGERDQAMSRYSRALEGSDEDGLRVRLALGMLFAEEGKMADAQQQVALGFAQAQAANTDPTAEDYLNGASILSAIHEYALAQRFYGRAQAAGADEVSVAVGMANAALAIGDTRSAEEQLATVRSKEDVKDNYEYLVALGSVNRQRGESRQALSLFAQANSLDPQDPVTRGAEMDLSAGEGRQITQSLGLSSDFHVAPIFEDDNIYQMDARLFGVQNQANLLPPPRRSIETWADSRFQYNLGSFPAINGFVAERNSQGSVSFPSQLLIQNRNTFDTIFNASISPVLSVGDVRFTIMPGLQYTVRRDTLAPVAMNQDLFRQFLYVASSPIANWVSFSGNVIREAGPFTEQDLHSRDVSAALDFRVAPPWSRTTLLTGYTARDLQFGPSIHEYYGTTSYVGLERRFGSRWTASGVAEYLRAWRVEGNQWTIAQTLRPRFSVDANLNQHWSLSATGAWSSGRSFHDYDSVTSGVLVSYVRAHQLQRADGQETASVAYPIRISFGLGQQTFYDFPGHSHTSVIPIVRFSLF
jgi:tetratricopeptide (TPR) repeat protein